ncbi:MAG: endonuclease/exonuclease/phosphatase family protein [Planctomycetes bacterium]|nr:endonuclease/exonuclease/phosphatase family protein [Planctomycetota bacterium]
MPPTRRLLPRALWAGAFLLVLGGTWVASWRIPAGAATGEHLATGETARAPHDQPQAPDRTTWRVATWNIHSGKGRDGRLDLQRIARQLAECDFVGLNEVRGTTGWTGPNQAEILGRTLNAGWLFHAYERRWGRDDFGNGVVSRSPVTAWERQPLPCTSVKGHGNIIRHTVTWNAQSIQILVTHIDRQADRRVQLRQACEQFLSLPAPAILMGDLNTTASDAELASLLATPGVVDVMARSAPPPSADRIDWILARGLECVAAGLIDHGESDHPLLWADLRLPDSQPHSPTPGPNDPTTLSEAATDDLR